MSSPRPAASYAAVLALPHARRTFGAAMLGRLGYGTVSLSLVLSLTSATGSLSSGGLLATLFATVSVALGPARAGLVDRWGPRRALPTLAWPFAAALFGLAALTGEHRPPFAELAALTAVAGALCPPLGPTMRALWDAMTPDGALLQRAFSLDTVAEELIFLTGPLLVVAVHPVRGLVLSGVVIAVGTLAMVTSPAVKLIAPESRTGAVRSRLRLLSAEGAGVRRAAYAALGSGCCLGGIDLYVIAFADHAHHGAAVGWILAAQSAGSALGGLLYGRIGWRLPAVARLPYLLALLAGLLALTGAAPGLPVLAVGVAATGTLISPVLATAYLAAADLAPAGTATRATTWVNSAVNAGSSAGGALAAVLVARAPLPLCFAVAAAAPAVAALVIRGRRAGCAAPAGRAEVRQQAA
ncbi:MFS transporter [Streptomyces sp. CA-111067]|uniref:MFS transporter n=1 Tax=Streptomyces sp. CA-111067 TaxID=3240046 RepID=UPI003D973F90